MPTNPFNPRITNWDVKWDAFDFGLVNKVSPKLKMVRKDIKRGTTGHVVIDRIVVALDGMIEVEVPDISADLVLACQPWMTKGDGQALISRVPNDSLYKYAKLLTLHPHDLGADNTDEDLNLIKGVPVSMFDVERDGEKENTVWKLQFEFFPDRDKLTGANPWLLYGYLGGTPPVAPTAPTP